MSTEEQRLAQLLKRMVPEPPFQLSAEEVTTQSARPSARSWTMPALAAAAVVAIGVTAGLVATHRPGPGAGTAPSAVSGASRSASPESSPTCQGRTVTVPNVVGESMNAAMAVIQAAGLTAGVHDAEPPESVHGPAGTVIAQSPRGDSRAAPGAAVELEIAEAASTSTAAPINPSSEPTASASPRSPCQVVTGTPAVGNATQSVPNLVGMLNNQATWAAHAAGFTATKVITRAPAARHLPPGTVFAQEPAAGSSAGRGSGLILYEASGS
jgi:hypothetical protein